jgi:hypothetical protein
LRFPTALREFPNEESNFLSMVEAMGGAFWKGKIAGEP